MSEPTDQNLLTAARGGDAQALEDLLMRYQPRVYRFGMKMCGDPEDAKDVSQETLLAMARGLRDFRGGSSLSTWLYTIARRFCVKKRQREVQPARPAQASASDEISHLSDPRPTPEEQVTSQQTEAVLAKAIAALDPKQREVLVLRDIEGLTAPQVAEIVGIGIQAVKSRLHRARLALRETLLPLLGEADIAEPALATCPDVLTLFSRHLEGEISSTVCAQMERHLEGCERCRTACDSLKATLALCQTTSTPRVPDDVQATVRSSLRQLLQTQT